MKDDIKVLLETKRQTNQKLQKLLNETEEIRRILKHKNYMPALDYVLPFIELEEAGKLRDHGAKSETMLIADMFNYGFILGKKAERKRKNKRNT